MIKDEILENNKLIAEFMDDEFFKSLGFTYKTPMFEKGKILPEHCKFHSSWNWLMAVVEKIENLSSYYIMEIKCCNSIEFTRNSVVFYFSPENNYKLHLELRNYKIDKDTWKHPMFKEHIIKQYDFKTNGKFMGLYTAIIEFIKWYNENK